MLKRSLGLYPTPHVECVAIFNQLVFQFEKCGSFEGIQSCRISLEYPRGGQFADGLRPRRPVKGVLHDQHAKQFLAILQLCWHCLAGRETGFQQSERLVGHVG